MTQRLQYIDALKGVAILLVVLGHSLQNFDPDLEWLPSRAIYAFHMPLFMFVSGFVSWKVYKWASVKKRAVQLLIPFFFSIVLAWFVNYWGFWSADGFLSYTSKVIIQPDLGLWFLWVLFFISILFVASRKAALVISKWLKTRELFTEICVVAVVAGLLNIIEIRTGLKTFGYHWIAWYFIFFSFGAYWRQIDALLSRKAQWRMLFASLIIFIPCTISFRMHNQAPLFYRWLNLGSLGIVAFRLFVGAVGCILCYLLLKTLETKTRIYSILAKIGGVTLGIYFLFFFFINFYREITPGWSEWIEVPLCFIFTLACTLPLIFIFKRFGITRLLCLGLPFKPRRPEQTMALEKEASVS